MTQQIDLYAPIITKGQEATNLTIRIPTSLRDQFKTFCESKGLDMSIVLRRFIESQIPNQTGE